MAQRTNFAARLRELCVEVGSISAVARDLDINRQQFARYLNGTTFPRPAVISRIADYFGVTEDALFSPRSRGNPEEAPRLRALPAITSLLSLSALEDATADDIEPGFYIQYKRSFRYNERIFVGLILIYQDQDEVLRFKRRTSPRYVNQLPGADPANQFVGVFARHGPALVMFDRGTSVGDLIIYGLLTAHHFNRDVKPGLHVSFPLNGLSLPTAARVYLERISGGCPAVLKAARQQGFYDDADVPERVRYMLDTPPRQPSHMLSVAL